MKQGSQAHPDQHPATRGLFSTVLAERREALQARRSAVEADYDVGLIDGRRLAAATARINADLEAVAREQGQLISAAATAGLLVADDPVSAFDAAPLGVQRRIIDALMVVTPHRVARGVNQFTPESVGIDWRGSAACLLPQDTI